MDDNPEMKKWLFVECLPGEEIERAKHLIIDGRMPFEELVQKYHRDNSILVTRRHAEKLWKNFVPQNKKWKSIDLWFSKWKRLATEVPELTEIQMIEQFDAVLRPYAYDVIKEIKKEEVLGKKISL